MVIVGLQTDMRDDIVVLKSLAKQDLAPVTTGAGRRMAKQLKATKYTECSSFTGAGVKAVFEEVISAAMKPPRRISRCTRNGGCTIL
ncbi:MAG: Rho GTPase [Candelina mexicana]|nr:MAG: Rho GTPase [Candelina mexicana]